MERVKVVDRNGDLLNSCKPSRARILLQKKRAEVTQVKGKFAIKLVKAIKGNN